MTTLSKTFTVTLFLIGTLFSRIGANSILPPESEVFINGSGKFQDLPPTTTMVYPGTNGRLVYIPDSLGNTIPDFSNAGYRGGGVTIPYVAVKATVWPVPGDNSANIQ